MAVDTFTDNAGVTHYLGNILAPVRYAWPVYGESGNQTPPLIPRSEWQERIKQIQNGRPPTQVLDEMRFMPYVHDQDGVGQCNADATVAMVEAQRTQQGLDFVKLSAPDLYGRINGGVDRGSLLEDAMAEMRARGVGTAATSGTLWSKNTKYASSEERARFKTIQIWVCPTFDHLMSATLMGFQGVSGIMWYSNYNTNAAGYLPKTPSGSAGGHAIVKGTAVDYSDGLYWIGHQNSWKESWGRKGRMWIAEPAFRGNVGGWWVARQVTTEEGDIPAPTN